jgi:hypothetical protein
MIGSVDNEMANISARNGLTKDLLDCSAREAWKFHPKVLQPKTSKQKYQLEQECNDGKLD